jgi:hypoxanthine phosphoribosyltransferase
LQLGRILITEEQIQKRVAELGERISKDYETDPPILVNVLKGGVVFLADLIRSISIPVEMDFMEVSSYGDGTSSSGVVRILEDLSLSITNRHVLIIEDIVDTGLTLKYIIENLNTRQPKSIRICTLLDRPDRREIDLTLDYVGFVVPNKYVIGYGLDLAQKYRNLPHISVIEDEEVP